MHCLCKSVESRVRGEMVVFQKHHVEETEAMIGPAAGDHSRFLERAKAGRRFTGVENFHAIVCGSIDKLSCQGCDPGQSLQKIQRDTLCFQNWAR